MPNIEQKVRPNNSQSDNPKLVSFPPGSVMQVRTVHRRIRGWPKYRCFFLAALRDDYKMPVRHIPARKASPRGTLFPRQRSAKKSAVLVWRDSAIGGSDLQVVLTS